MIKKEDGKIDWTKSAVEIERQIRAMSPWPSAFTKVNGKNLKIWDAKVIAMFGGDLFSKIPGQNPTKLSLIHIFSMLTLQINLLSNLAF